MHPAETNDVENTSVIKPFLLEIACFNISSAIAASNAGADRIELCDNPADGGTTPSYGMLKIALEKINIPVFPIIRPRGGDFLYSNDEYQVMLYNVQLCRQLNCKGIVTGLLQKDGSIDVAKTRQLVKAAGTMAVTFHRAFDRAINPLQALEDIIATGCKRVLTSGQEMTSLQGKGLIKDLIAQANNRIVIMPGGGVRSTNLQELLHHTRAVEFHSGARKDILSHMEWKPKNIAENSTYTGVDVAEIHIMKTILANEMASI